MPGACRWGTAKPRLLAKWPLEGLPMCSTIAYSCIGSSDGTSAAGLRSETHSEGSPGDEREGGADGGEPTEGGRREAGDG